MSRKSRWISDLHWVRAGQQTRSQRTQESLLEAAEELFRDLVEDAGSESGSDLDDALPAGDPAKGSGVRERAGVLPNNPRALPNG